MEEPPADGLAWVASALGARVVGVASMSGGIDAHMFHVSLVGWNALGLPVAEGEASQRRLELLDRARARLP